MILAAAAFGEDAAALRKRIQRLPGDAARNPLVEWYAAILTGDRAEANRLSAAVDAGPAGPLLLAVRTGICMCGAPFDLEATPNFKARLAESGLPWPPVDASGNLKRAQEGGR